MKAYLDHHRFTDHYRSPFEDAPRTPSPSFRKAQNLLRPGQQLSEHAAKQLLRAYGIRVPREQLVTSAAAAVRAAGPVGYPVVMKASGPRLAHKTELGLVKVGLTSASQVRDAYRELTDIARYESVDLDGILVCQMIDRGVEMMVGVTHDALFGPTVTVGLGGVWWRCCTTRRCGCRRSASSRPGTCWANCAAGRCWRGCGAGLRSMWTRWSRWCCGCSAWPWNWATT